MQWELEKIYKEQVKGNIPQRKHLKVLGEDDQQQLFRQLTGGNSLEKNVRVSSNYNFKSVDKFKYNFVGSNYKYGERLNKIELGKLISLYDKVSGRSNRRLFREISNF